MSDLDSKNRKILLSFQKNEITEYHVYLSLAKSVKDKNKEVLQHIANDELRHYDIWKNYTKTEIKPSKWLIFKYTILARILGLTFAIKLMEKGEKGAQASYNDVENIFPEAKQIMTEEHEHERELIDMIKEKKLDYMGSIVLGLNDALVELTGALAGLSFALQNNRLVALAGLITGISASFSMAASEYLSKKHEGDKNAFKASVYTGIAYVFTVLFLVFPFLIMTDYRWSLGWTLINAIIVIFVFTYYNAIVKSEKFRPIFLEMATISLSVAFISFLFGIGLKMWLGVEI